MDCRAFEGWLDGGRPDADAASAAVHRGQCPACEALAVQDDALELALAARGADPGDAFTAGVMSRLPAARRAATPAVEPDLLLPWWAQVLREPEAALGLLLGGLYAGATPWLLPRLIAATSRLSAGSLPVPADLGLSPVALAALVLPALGAGTWLLYRAATHAFARLGAAS